MEFVVNSNAIGKQRTSRKSRGKYPAEHRNSRVDGIHLANQPDTIRLMIRLTSAR